MRSVLVGLLVVPLLGMLSGCGGDELPPPKPVAPAPRPPVTAQPSPPAPTAAQPTATPQPQATAAQPTSPAPAPAAAPAQPTAMQPVEVQVPPLSAESLPTGVRADSPEARSLANLKAIAAAMAVYQQHEKHFPAAVIYDGDKPLLSWRVALLPSLGQEELFKQFNLKEPWNSPHNMPLMAKIPTLYQTPGMAVDGKTCYVVPSGLGTIFGQRDGLSEKLIGDGKDKTLLLVEADADRAVVWTEPKDLDYAPALPLSGLGQLRNGVFCAAMADGGVREVLVGWGEIEIVRALFSANGHEPIDLAALDVKLKQRVIVPAPAAAPPATAATSPAGPPPAGMPAEPAAGGAPAAQPVTATSKLQSDALAALAKGNQKRGLSCLLAEAARGDAGVLQSVRWSPALKRPLLLLRCGLVVQAPGAPVASEAAPSHNRRKTVAATPKPSGVPEALTYWGTALGKPLLEKLQARVGEGRFGKWLQAARLAAANLPSANPDNQTHSPGQITDEGGILNLGLMEEAKTLRPAAKEGLDVLIVAAIVNKPVKIHGKILAQSNLTIRVIDVASGDTLWKSKPVNSAVSGGDGGDSAESGRAATELLNDTLSFLDENVLLGDVPKLTAEAAQQRAETITAKTINPLPALAELRYYQSAKLLTPEQLSDDYVKLLGAEDGPRLATGAESVRKEILEKALGLE